VHKVQDLERGARVELGLSVRQRHQRLAEPVGARPLRRVLGERREAAQVAARARHLPGLVERVPRLELALPRRAVAARHAPRGHGALLRRRLVQLHGYFDRGARCAVQLAERERRVDGIRARPLHGRLEGVSLGLFGRRQERARDTRDPWAPERRRRLGAEVDADDAQLRLRVREPVAQGVRAVRGHLRVCARDEVHDARPRRGRLAMSLLEHAVERERECLERCVSGPYVRSHARGCDAGCSAWSTCIVSSVGRAGGHSSRAAGGGPSELSP